MKKSQARGYLYEILISHLLEKNHFLKCEKDNQVNKSFKCGISSADGEVLGRGTHHQIDFVGIYEKHIPFIYPIRLLAECKFWTTTKESIEYYKKVDKSFIREYIGVYKDISENYYSLYMSNYTRFLDVPIIFSAGGFDHEAEKLAWAHGINIVSHSKLPIMAEILEFINFIVNNFPNEFVENKEKFKELKEIVSIIIKNTMEEINPNILSFIENIKANHPNYETQMDNFTDILFNIRNIKYKTFLFATTNNGKLINLISYNSFPDELFLRNEEQECGIFFEELESNIVDENTRVFYITLNNDEQERRFYFQANHQLLRDDFSSRSLKRRLEEKQKYFTKLSIIKEIDGLTRVISIKVNFENIMEDLS